MDFDNCRRVVNRPVYMYNMAIGLKCERILWSGNNIATLPIDLLT